VFGMYYYLKIANAMFMGKARDSEPVSASFGLRVALLVTAIATVGIGIFPDRFIQAVNWSLSLTEANSIAKVLGR